MSFLAVSSLTAVVIGPLTEADTGFTRAPKDRSIKRITERHHAMARAVAQGANSATIAVVFNLDQHSASLMMRDPAFTQLVTFYRDREIEVLRTTQERMADVTNEAIAAVEEVLEDDAKREKLSMATRLEIVKTFADRSGNGPMNKSVQVHVHANLADRMKRAREQAEAAMIDVTPKEAAE